MKLYKDILDRLEKIDFNVLFPGFKRYEFALYNKETVYFKDSTIPWDNRFIGNTSIIYEGKYIAIWNLEYSVDDMDIFTSKIVHEMFHAFQLENHETRWGDEFEALDYKYEDSNINGKLNESRLLNQHKLEEMMYLRESRKKKYPKELQYETKIETIEGMARYVELEVLNTLNEKTYNEEIQQLKEMISNPSNYIPIRHISYEIGAYLLIIAAQKNIDFTHLIGKETATIYDIISSQLRPKAFSELVTYNLDCITTYKEKIQHQINNVLAISTAKLIDDITGLDPLNTFKVKDMIYFKHFVRYEQDNSTHFEFNPSVYSVIDSKLYIK